MMNLRRVVQGVVTLVAAWAVGVRADSQWWDTATNANANAGSGVWSIFSNSWAGTATPALGVAPGAWTNGNDAFFTVVNTGNFIGVSNVTANSITITAAGYVFTNYAGGVLTIGAGGITISSAATFQNDINLGTSQTWTPGATLTMAGVVTEDASPVTLTKSSAGLVTFSNNVLITGGLVVNAGTVRNLNAAITTPFGVGDIVVNNGTLALTPVGGSAAYLGVTNAGAMFLFGTNAVLQTTRAAGQTLTYTIGAGDAVADSVLVREGQGTLVLAYSAANLLGGAERFLVNGGVTNINSMVAPFIVGRAASGAYDFLVYDAVNGFTNVTYDLTNPTSGGTTTSKLRVSTGMTLAGNLTGFAARVSGAGLNLGGNQLVLGDGVNPVGLSLDATTILNGTLLINGDTELLVPVNGTGILGAELAGNGLLNKFGTGTLIVSNAGLYAGGALIQSGTLSFFPTADVTLGGAINGLGTFRKDGPQNLTLTGTNSLLGGDLVVVGGGALVIEGQFNVGQVRIGTNATSSGHLIVTNSGVLISTVANIGTNGVSNFATVTGSGSVWSNTGALMIGGGTGAQGNQLTISAGGRVVSAEGIVGGLAPAGANVVATLVRDNIALVTDTGSVWQVLGALVVGRGGADSGGNLLIISNGGMVVSGIAGIGDTASNNIRHPDTNQIIVTGPGSVWTNLSAFYIGRGAVSGSSDSNGVIIANGGAFYNRGGGVFIGGDNLASGLAPDSYITVTGTGSVMDAGSQGIFVGTVNSPRSRLNILDGGVVISSSGAIGTSSGRESMATVSGPGSVWTIEGSLQIGGGSASGAQLVISNAGVLVSGSALFGVSNATNSMATIVGAGSTWTNTGSSASAIFQLGVTAPSNVVRVVDGGLLYVRNTGAGAGLTIGQNSRNNQTEVVGAGSVLDVTGEVIQLSAAGGQSNLLSVADGGAILAGDIIVGNAGLGDNAFLAGGFGLRSFVTSAVLRVGNTTSANSVLATNVSLQTTGLFIATNGGFNNSVTIREDTAWDFGGGAIVVGSVNGVTSASGNSLTTFATDVMTGIGGISLYDAGADLFLSNQNLAATITALNLGSPGLGGNTLTLSNQPAFTSTAGSMIGRGSSNNLLTLLAGTMWDAGNQLLTLGTNQAAGNVITVSAGSTITNIGGVSVGGSGHSLLLTNNRLYLGSGNALNVGTAGGDGGNLLIISNQTYTASAASVIGNNSSSNRLVVLDNTLWNNSGLDIFVGTLRATGNVLVINGGVLTNVGAMRVGTGTGGGATDNSLIITNGGQLFSVGKSFMGGRGSLQNNSNTILVAGGGALWDFGGTGGGLDIADQQNAASSYNTLIVDGLGVQGGAKLTNMSVSGTSANALSIGLGASFLPSDYNTLILANGGEIFITLGHTEVGGGPNNNRMIVDGGTFQSGGGLTIGRGASAPAALGIGDTNSLLVTGGGYVSVTRLSVGANHLRTSTAGMPSASNTITVAGANALGSNSIIQLNGGSFDIGNGIGSTNNRVIIGLGGVITNAGIVGIGASTRSGGAFDNGLIVTNGGRFFSGSVTVGNLAGADSNFYKIDGGATRSTVSNGVVTIGSSGGQFNWLTVANADVWSTGLLVGNGGSNNTATLWPGTTWDNSAQRVVIGTNAAIANLLTIAGPDARLTNAGAIMVGASATSSGNQLVITNGGVLQGLSLTVGGNVAAVGNSALILAGGLLEANILSNFPGSVGNTISNVGGIYQFTTATPAIKPATPGAIALTDGTISYRAVDDADITRDLGIAFAGNNTFMLNAASNTTAGQTYTFDTGNPSNYVGLALANGRTAYRGGDVTIGAGGSLLLSHTEAMFTGSVTNDGVATLVESLVDFQNGLHVTGTLRGNGTVVGDVTVPGTVSPGLSIGTLVFSNNLTLSGAYLVDLDNTGSGSNDLIQVLGVFDLTGASLVVTELQGADTANDAAYVLATYGTLAGTFAGTSGLPAGYTVDYNFNNANMIAIVVIPEPSAFVLLGFSLLGFLLVRRRRA